MPRPVTMKFTNITTYRKDIDGLRAIAVIAVIIFHFGLLPNGYLGVDVFFVISGYLITSIIYRELNNNSFSITNFYLRRARRILPLSLFIVSVALIIGICVMLPDDLENLAQSVIATNFFSNNILQAITTKNYWDVVNEFKPLMHTWSLGVEEQYYLFYPLLFILAGKKHLKLLLPLLFILTFISLWLYFSPYETYKKFYYIPFRFFELSIGGIAAITLKNKLIDHKFSFIFIFGLIFILFSDTGNFPSQWLLLMTVILTTGIIVSYNENSKVSFFILENKVMIFLGLISFSLYMWHQILLAFTRYFVVQKLETIHLIYIFILTIILSVITYYIIEQPFRNKNKIKTRYFLSILAAFFLVSTLAAFYIYIKGGVLKDIPELGIVKDQAQRNIHAKYNSRIYAYDKPFEKKSRKLKVLIIGNSFARDWANVLLESKFKNKLNISYVYNPFHQKDIQLRIQNSDLIFYSTASKEDIHKLGIDTAKLYVVGTKNFGINSGYFYNYAGKDYFQQRTLMEDGYLIKNQLMKQQWGERYIDYISRIINNDNTVPVFTPDKMFISQDCRHFTKAGAMYFAHIFEDKLAAIFNNTKKQK